MFIKDSPDRKWAKQFVGCKLPNTGHRFNETVDVLEKKLQGVRAEGLNPRIAPMTQIQDPEQGD